METVLIAGGRGLIGQRLQEFLKGSGYKCLILSRKITDHTRYWDPEKGEIDENALQEADCIINLAGESIAGENWTNNRKARIISSRVKPAEFLYEKMQQSDKQTNAYLSASAIGYYGNQGSEKIFTETDKAAQDFLAQTCVKWENAAHQFEEAGIRTVILRLGVVLARGGGMLTETKKPVMRGLGAAIGNGRQYIPWVHIDDVCRAFVYALQHEDIQGVYNITAPQPVRNKAFTQQLCQKLNKPFRRIHVPAIVVRSMLGEMADLALRGSRISSEKITAKGFSFKYSKLSEAFDDLL